MKAYLYKLVHDGETLQGMPEDFDGLLQQICLPAPSEYDEKGAQVWLWFKKKRKELTCTELKMGRTEADAARKVLRSSSAGSLSPAQVSRGTLLAAEVSRDLRREMKRRCKGKA